MKLAIVVLGLFFVVSPALERFNHQPHARCTTTAFRYYVSAICYLSIYIVVFFAFMAAPKLLAHFPGLLGGLGLSQEELPAFYLAGNQSTVYGIAVLTIMAVVASNAIHNIPLLSHVDGRLVMLFHRVAAIPIEARRFSHQLQSLAIELPPSVLPEARGALEKRGLSGIRESEISSSQALCGWLQAYSIFTHLDQWKGDTLFSAFFFERESQFRRLEVAYERLTELAIGVYSLRAQVGAKPEAEPLQLALKKMEEGLSAGLRDFHSEACDFISHALLASCLTHRQRVQKAREFGFAHPGDIDIERIDYDKVLLTFMVLGVVTLTIFTQLQSESARAERALMVPVLITCSYGVAIMSVIICRRLFDFCRSARPGQVRYLGYAFTALVATALASVLHVLLTALIQPDAIGIGAALAKSWQSFAGEGFWTFRVMTFTAAFMFAYLVDTRTLLMQSRRASSVANGAAMAGALLLAALLAYSLYTLYDPNPAPRSLFGMLMPQLVTRVFYAVLAGFIIGALVPVLVRAAEDKEEVPAPAVQPGTASVVK